MASLLLNCECVDLKNKTYKMTWWATALNQISVPDNMNMCGGSIAVVTASNGVKTYVYNSATGAWKEKSGVDVSGIETDIQQLKTGLSSLTTVVAGMGNKIPEVDMGLVNVGNVSANSSVNQSVDFNFSFTDRPYVFTTIYVPESAVVDNAYVGVGVVARREDGVTLRIMNGSSTQRNVTVYWLAIYIP